MNIFEAQSTQFRLIEVSVEPFFHNLFLTKTPKKNKLVHLNFHTLLIEQMNFKHHNDFKQFRLFLS